jgi:hypothetical protein
MACSRHPWPEDASVHVFLTALGDTMYELFQEWWGMVPNGTSSHNGHAAQPLVSAPPAWQHD